MAMVTAREHHGLMTRLHNATASRDYYRKSLKASRAKLKAAHEEISSLLAEAEAKEKK